MPQNRIALPSLNLLADAYQQYIGDPFAAVAGGLGRGYLSLEKPAYVSDDAYRMGQALGNMPGLGAPAGAVKAIANAPEVLSVVGGGLSRRMLQRALKPGANPSDYLPAPTVSSPQTVAFPDIYLRPDILVGRTPIAPPDPSLERLFGVTREDLYEMSKRKGTFTTPPFKTAANPKGAAHAANIMTPQNEQRLLDILAEARKNQPLWQGMHGWYVMDPVYQRLVQLVGPEQAKNYYARFNGFTGMSSPNSEVLTELARGTGANWLAQQGRFSDFVRYGGGLAPGRPADMSAIPGHLTHSTAQAYPMSKSIQAGFVDVDANKVPTYIWSSGVPEMGFQTAWPVGDAHYVRGIGLPDVRSMVRDNKTGLMIPRSSSATTPEMVSIGPWWREKIAGPAGIEAVPGQAILWGAGSTATGVTSPIAAPKLELLSQQIMRAADRMGVTPETARDMILLGQAHAGFANPLLLGGAALGTGAGLLGYNYLREPR